MIDAISGAFSFGILIGTLVFVFRLSKGKKAKGILGVLLWIFAISTLAFSILNLNQILDLFEFKRKLVIQNGIVGLFLFSSLALFAYGFLSPPTSKKLKAMLRLPVIGLLTGWVLRPEQFFYVILFVELLMLGIAFKNKKSHLYLWRAQLKSSIALPLAAFYMGTNHFLFLFWFLWSFVFKISMINAAIVKGAMVDYDETLHEEKNN